MEDIQHVIKDIVDRCASLKHSISPVLAAFVVRTLIDSDPVHYPPDRQIGKAEVRGLIECATERLLAQDDPALETIKMQVEFDSAYYEEEQRLEAWAASRERRLKEMVRRVIQNKPKHGTDFDTINTIYRDIFKFILMDHHSEGLNDKAAEREIAAAVESVFPRIGVRAFTQLGSNEKRGQLSELAHVVLGIRLLNKAMDKGGAGIEYIDREVEAMGAQLKDSLAKEVEFLSELCGQYQETLVYAHMVHLRDTPSADSLVVVDRLRDELANRRQFHAYLQSVQEDVLVSWRRCEQLLTRLREHMGQLQDLVGGRATVPKEQVYPRFDALAVTWQQLDDERKVLRARTAIYSRLSSFRGSFKPIFNSRLPLFKAAIEHQQTSALHTLDEEEQLAAAAAGASTSPEDDEGEAPRAFTREEGAGREEGQGDEGEGKVVLNREQEQWYTLGQGKGKVEVKEEEGGGEGGNKAAPPDDRPLRLTMTSSPEFMQLPLEFQGFCAWTLLHRRGLLLPGKPALGVVRYHNAFYVFAHEVALRHFIKHPEEVLSGMRRLALESPELIHLLRMHDTFPHATIRALLRAGVKSNNQPGMAGVEVKDKVSCGTETPLHFTERHKDHTYQWNEWQLRRRALQVVKLRKCKTVAQQTDASHFRRENDSQVFPPKVATTQTTTGRGSNPPVTVTYLAGLRHSELKELGQPGPLQRPSRYIKERESAPDKAGIVSLTFEHTWEPLKPPRKNSKPLKNSASSTSSAEAQAKEAKA